MFDRFEESARVCIVLAHEEARGMRHRELAGEHLLLGINEQDPALLGVRADVLRRQVIALFGSGDQPSPEHMPFSATAKRALELSLEEALDRGHERVSPAHIFLALLREDAGARRVVEALGRPVEAVLPRAEAATERGVREAPADVHQALREGDPVSVSLGGGLPIGDLGNPRTDVRLLLAMLAAGGRAARLLREHGLDEDTIRNLSSNT